MAISLDGIAVDLVWAERYTSQKVVQSVLKTLGGNPVVYAGAVNKGLPITLTTSGTNRGVLKKSVVDQLLALAETPGAIYVLVFNADSFNVMFRHDDAPAVDMTPLQPQTLAGETDLMVGSIKLLTV